jgi:multiple sugar transport system ATP-binding protein
MSLATRIAILSAGELQQIGTPDEVYDRPANIFVAEFIGSPPMNLLHVTRDGDTLVAEGGWRLPMPGLSAPPPGRADGLTVGLRPEAIVIGDAGQAAEVVAVEPLGSEVIVDVRVGGKTVKVRAAPTLRPQPGSSVHISAAPGGIRLFDRSSGSALH